MDMHGSQWSSSEIAVMTATRADTKNKLGEWMMNKLDDAVYKTLIDPPFELPIIDRDMLNKLDQPTAYEAQQKRKHALHLFIQWCEKTAIARLEGRTGAAATFGAIVENYKTKFQFTQEEIDGYRREEN